MYKGLGASLDPLQQIMTMATLAEDDIILNNEVPNTRRRTSFNSNPKGTKYQEGTARPPVPPTPGVRRRNKCTPYMENIDND